MTPDPAVQALIPPADPFGLPAPAIIFVLLLNLTLVLHFIAMGYVLTASLLQIFWSAAARPGNNAEWMLRRTEGPLPVALSFTITLGVAPLLFVQVLFGQFFYTANIMIGYQWIGLLGALMVGFYLIYVLYGSTLLGRRIPPLLEALGRVVIFVCFLYIMATHTMNAILVQYPESWPIARQTSPYAVLFANPILWPKLVHNFFAALVIGAVWLLALGNRSAKLLEDAQPGLTADQNPGRALAKLGVLLGVVLMIVQVMVGLWLLLSEPKDVLAALFTGRPAAILWMTSLALTLAMMATLLVAFAQYRNRVALYANWLVLGLLLGGMFAGRQLAREVRLAPYFKLEEWPVTWQVSSLALFLVLFVIMLIVLAVMIKWVVAGWSTKVVKTVKPAPAAGGR